MVFKQQCFVCITKGRFSRHPKCFSNTPLWSAVHHGVVTIVQPLGQGRLGPVGLTGSTGGRVLGACWGRLALGALAPCALLFQGLLEQACEPTGASQSSNLRVQ